MFTQLLRGVLRHKGRTLSPRRRVGAFRLNRSMALESLEDRRLLATVTGQKFHDIDADGQKDAAEPGLNGWTIQLSDTAGGLVGTRTTADRDLDANGQIDPATESGLYEFAGLAAGTYVVREVLQAGWVQTTVNATTDLASQLDQTHGFFIDLDVYLNWQGANEKWVRAANQNDAWFYILPNGDLYDWDDRSGLRFGQTPINGTLIAALGPVYYAFPSLLANAPAAGSSVVTPGRGTATANFGNFQPNSLHGRKWHDLNADGTRDAGEPFLNGWTIELLNAAGNVAATTTTMDMDVDGSGAIDPETETGLYWFDGLIAGSYTVREVRPTGWVQSAPLGDVELNFALGGDQENPPAESQATGSCASVLSADLSSFQVNCTHDVVETNAAHIHHAPVGMNGPVIIGFASGASPLSLTWDASSTPPLTAHDVDDLLAGNLYVNVHSPTFPGGEIRGQIPAATQQAGNHEVNVSGGQRIEGLDFGNYQPASVHGRKWHDLDGDGQLDSGEPFLNGWTIELLDATGSVVATTLTMDMDLDGSGSIDPATESGWYWFNNVKPGSYTVREERRDGWLQSAPAGADVTVTIENLAPSGGLFLTPFWVGFHDGAFDLYDLGSPASLGLERVAEDGEVGVLSAEFVASSSGMNGGVDGVITSPDGFPGAPVFDPGESPSVTFDLDPAKHRYFSYASMIIPSNDAFIANGNPRAHELFDADGNFTGPITFTVLGQDVRDSGTEENTEMEAAFINQTGPDRGTPTVDGVVVNHQGFINSLGNPGGTPIILGGTTAAGTTLDPVLADFTQPDTSIAQITIEAIQRSSHAGSLVSGARSEGLDFGNYQPVSIHGRKWNDLNSNGNRDEGEPFLNGWTIELVDESGNVVATTTTMEMDLDGSGDIDPATESGWYWFNDLVPGTYTVSEVLREGWVQSAPLSDVELTFALGGDQENPPTDTQATGSCTSVLRADYSSFQIDCTHDVVETTAAHIHHAPVGMNGPVIIGFASGESPLSLVWDASSTPPLTAHDVDDLLAGNLYVNVHSPTFPGGEIRGQIPAATQVRNYEVTLASG